MAEHTTATETHHHVMVQIPLHLATQLVFRMEVAQPLVSPPPMAGMTFTLIDKPRLAFKHWPLLREVHGLVGALKSVMKMTRRRAFYCVTSEAGVLHSGWVTSSYCRHYRVERGDIVIGSVATSHKAQAKGIGTFATRMVINLMMARGHRVFFIDTSLNNAACRKMIDNCGFGAPVATYLRD